MSVWLFLTATLMGAKFGGGALIDGVESGHFIHVVNSTFLNNVVDQGRGGGGGGGMCIGFLTARTTNHSVEFDGCTFVGNRGTFGGGSYVYPGVGIGRTYRVAYRTTTFRNNEAEEYGAAIGFPSNEFCDSRGDQGLFVIEDCMVTSSACV